MSKEILVFAELRDGKLRQVTLEALSVASTYKEQGQLTVAVLGEVEQEVFTTLAAYGADQILSMPDPRLNHYSTDLYVLAWRKAIETVSPDVILAGHTAIGKDVSPRIAAKYQWGLLSDCTQIQLVDGQFVCTRPIYAGKAFETKTIKKGVAFITIRPNNLDTIVPDSQRRAAVQELSVDLDPKSLRTIVKEVVRKSGDGLDLTEAKIIVSGGRGVKSADGFQPLQELADVLGAAVGASRGACDAGYCDYALQIGQTGKVVTPDLYIACGISGAIQHIAGMSASKVIVAINKDPEAPIFQIADYGIVGDLFQVVPLLTNEFRQLLHEQA